MFVQSTKLSKNHVSIMHYISLWVHFIIHIARLFLCLSVCPSSSCLFLLAGAGKLPFSVPSLSLIGASGRFFGSRRTSIFCFFLLCLYCWSNSILSLWSVSVPTVSVCFPLLLLAVSSFSLSLSVFLSSSYSVTCLGMEFLPHSVLEFRRWWHSSHHHKHQHQLKV